MTSSCGDCISLSKTGFISPSRVIVSNILLIFVQKTFSFRFHYLAIISLLYGHILKVIKSGNEFSESSNHLSVVKFESIA